MDPNLTGALAGLGTFGGLVAVLVILVKVAWPSLKDTLERVAAANRRADDAERRAAEAWRTADHLRVERDAALLRVAELQRQLLTTEGQLVAATAENDRLRNPLGGPL